MKIVFWLLDVNSEVRNDLPEIWLWGIDDSDNRILVIDRNFLPYFYAIVEENVDPKKAVEQIRKHQYNSVLKLEAAERKLFGKPVKAIKVYCKDPDAVAKCAKALRSLEDIKDCFEEDVRFSMRYLIDNDVVPCGWHEVEVAEETNTKGLEVNNVYAAKSAPETIEKSDIPKLRILGFSTIRYSHVGSPKPDRDPVILISTATSNGKENQFCTDEDRNDKPVIEAFIDHVRQFDPDIIAGYDVNTTEWPYLLERCSKLRLKLHVDRAKTEPHTSVYGHVSLTGRINIDLSDFSDEFPDVKVKTLANLADYLGIMKIEKRSMVEDTDIADNWDDKNKRETLKQFSRSNTQCIMGITSAVLDFGMQLSNLVRLPLDHVETAAAGFRVEWFLIGQTHRTGELAPRRIEQPYRSYTGGIVLAPKPGLHENIAALDFKSMYPNLMIAYNLSPDTYLSPKEPDPPCGVNEAPEVKHRFRKEPPGFYKEVLSYLIRARDEIRSKMKTLDSRSVEYRVLDARQKAVKVIANATYGYAGWIGARWYAKPVAEAATAWGRYTIMQATKMAEAAGLKVLYGDTDSIFVTYDEAKIAELSKQIKDKLKLEIQPDKIYKRIFFTEAKKRYAGLLHDGRLDIVGLEVMRGDWATIAKNVQEKVLEIILKERSPKKAEGFVQKSINELRQKRVQYRDLVIWKALTKPSEEYQIKAPHVEAAKMLQKEGWNLAAGDKIGYVVVVGSGRLYERVRPYMFATYDDIDVEYYVTKQIVPAAARILESFGITEEQLLSSKSHEGEAKITDFFRS